jgi:hypothetical protein
MIDELAITLCRGAACLKAAAAYAGRALRASLAQRSSLAHWKHRCW